jgi:hypothetical protein
MTLPEQLLQDAGTGLAFTPAGFVDTLHPGCEWTVREAADACSELLVAGKLDRIKPGYVGLREVIASVNISVSKLDEGNDYPSDQRGLEALSSTRNKYTSKNPGEADKEWKRRHGGQNNPDPIIVKKNP